MTKKSQVLRNALISNSRLLVLILLFCFFAVFTDTFWSLNNWSNVRNIVFQQAPFTILLALSMTLAITISGFDLSIGSAVAAISCTVAISLRATHSVPLALFLGIFLGAVVGLANGILVAKIGIPTFIATYTMQWILRGTALVLLGGSQIYDFGPNFRRVFTDSPHTFLMICAAVCLTVHFLLTRTNYGRYVYSIGVNRPAAQLSGIRTTLIIIATFILSGVIVGLTSILYIANLGTAEASIGESFNLNAIAATLVGGTTIGGGGGKVSNAVVGSLIMLVLTNGMIQIGIPSVWQQVVIGAVIILSVIAEKLMQKFAVETA